MLGGDAGQRALVAWHAGFEPAQQASGEDWLAPALTRLLQDDYLVIRIIAERALDTLERGPGGAASHPRPRPWVGVLEKSRTDDELLDRLFEGRDRRRVSLAE